MKQYLIICFLLTGFQLLAQEQLLNGRVQDDLGSPLARANIIRTGKFNTGTSTDYKGFFSIGCRPGDTLVISYMGYESQTIPITHQFLLKNPGLVSFQLSPKYLRLEQVTISATKDKKFKYLLDFDLVGSNILKLEIRGFDKYLILSDSNDFELWNCKLPEYMNKSRKLDRDFVGNIIIQSDDSTYETYLTETICNIRTGIAKSRYNGLMEGCIAMTSNGLIFKELENYNKSVFIWCINRTSKKKIYAQNDILGFMHYKDYTEEDYRPRGLGFQFEMPHYESSIHSFLDYQYQLKGAPPEAVMKNRSRSINVEVFTFGDSVYILDNYVGAALVFNCYGDLLNQVPMEFLLQNPYYHYVKDDAKKSMYGISRKKSGISLTHLGIDEGRFSMTSNSLDMIFPQKIRIFNNKAYYMKYNHLANKRSLVITQLKD